LAFWRHVRDSLEVRTYSIATFWMSLSKFDLLPPIVSKVRRGLVDEGEMWMPQGLRSRVGSRCDVSDVQPPSHFPAPALPHVIVHIGTQRMD